MNISIKLIIKDSVVTITRCFIATILICVCLKNGWLSPNQSLIITYDAFWRLFSAVFILVPIILFFNGASGKYLYHEEKYYEEKLGNATIKRKSPH